MPKAEEMLIPAEGRSRALLPEGEMCACSGDVRKHECWELSLIQCDWRPDLELEGPKLETLRVKH